MPHMGRSSFLRRAIRELLLVKYAEIRIAREMILAFRFFCLCEALHDTYNFV